MGMAIEEFIRKLPKAELNIHLEGCLDPTLIKAFADRNSLQLPAGIESHQPGKVYANLADFLATYNGAVSVLRTEKDFFDLTSAYINTAALQNIFHFELSFNPQIHLDRGIEFASMYNGITNALQEGKKNFNISSLLVMCIMSDHSLDEANKLFELALPYKDGIVAIGLDSNETGNPPEKFKSVFHKAKEHGFLTVASAGEVGPPEYIWQAIEILEVSRIEHGVQCMQDPDLITRLSAKQIPLDICPVADVKLSIYPSLRHHPIKQMHEEGLFVTVNSNNPAFFGANLTENFLALNAALKFNKPMIYELVKNSFQASFLEYARQEKMINELNRFYKQAMGDAP